MRRLPYLIVAVVALAVATAGVALAAIEAAPVRYAMISMAEPGGRVLFYFEVKNVSTSPWAPGAVTLNNTKNAMGAAGQYGVTRSVYPNETAYWDFEVTAPKTPGVHESVWEIRRAGQAISPRLTCYVVAVPEEARELRGKIQKLIDDFNSEHGHEVEQLVRMIRELIQNEGKSLIQRLIDTRCGLVPGMLGLLSLALALRRPDEP